MKTTIYLAGKVPKSDNENFIDWRFECKKILGENNYQYISPIENRADETDSFAVFGQCCSQIQRADIILVNASEKLGAGTSQEMLIAKYYSKKVVTYLPKNTPHRKTDIILTGKHIKDWIHPFIFECSDFIIEAFEDLNGILSQINDIKIKNLSIIDDARIYYEKNYLNKFN